MSAAAPADAARPLLEHFRRRIALEGPVGLDDYMATALMHPAHGYYATRDPLGPAGDFTTAPEISQMFGELIGLWLADAWDRSGRPSPGGAGRARPRPRHADGRRAARRDGAAGIPPGRAAGAGGGEPGPATGAGPHPGGASPRLGRPAGGPSGRPGRVAAVRRRQTSSSTPCRSASSSGPPAAGASAGSAGTPRPAGWP